MGFARWAARETLAAHSYPADTTWRHLVVILVDHFARERFVIQVIAHLVGKLGHAIQPRADFFGRSLRTRQVRSDSLFDQRGSIRRHIDTLGLRASGERRLD